MKRYATLFCIGMAMAALVLVPSTSLADSEGSATATVHATVNPNVTLGVNTAIVDAGTIQTGNFSATISFRVDANVQFLNLYLCVSALYKGADPTGTEVAPIPVNLSQPPTIQPTNANPAPGNSNTAEYIGAGTPIDGFPCQQTESVNFESSQSGHFSQDVVVNVWWNQNDPEKPTGVYTGKVTLVAFIIDSQPSG